ncbi:DoxX family protein [Actinomadura rupiterrae]|uniref:DoxX family protein n=1 Tax=Actinomadura rupiterrae TaxID=559627 RepID=UPI0020A551C9|nr:DoxX family protein [Actinomadura rupiterrae]MCP2339521.1 putative oxidoreductase [Actinomadura rupiterrae]
MYLSRRFPALTDAALLLGRLVLGVVFVAHGWQKFHKYGHATVTKMFDGMGIPLPGLAASYATWVELAGGVLLIVGVLTPLVGLLLFGDMAGALWFAHADHGFFSDKGGYEYVLVLAVLSLLVAFAGPGRVSLDALLGGGLRREQAADGRRAVGV